MGQVPQNPASMIACYAVLFLLSCGVASFNLVASSYSSAWEKLWPSFLRVQYFTCGVFYHPLDMPEDIRALILLNPLVHVTEWMRQAYFHSYESPFLDIPYLLRCTIAAALLGTVVFAATACSGAPVSSRNRTAWGGFSVVPWPRALGAVWAGVRSTR
jgi:ABC-type polysaccharide/polyol phosphate export permease